MSDRWVCLLYHDVSVGPAHVSGGKEHFSVGATAFGAQLDMLKAEGYAGLSIAEAFRHQGPCVGISFDDGDIGQYARAFPALASRGMTATFFITTSWVGTPGYASWPQLKEMRAAGMSIQSHTHSHPFLSELSAARLTEEFRASKRALDDQLGQDTDTLAFPGGDMPQPALRSLLAEAGYRFVATSRWGLNHAAAPGEAGLVWVRRCTVRGTPALGWLKDVARGDPWIAAPRMLREELLHRLRSTLGPTRYARWRRRFLGALAGSSERPSAPA